MKKKSFIIGLLLITSTAFADVDDVTYNCKKRHYDQNAEYESIIIKSTGTPFFSGVTVPYSSKDGSYAIVHDFETGKIYISLRVVSGGETYESAVSGDGKTGVELKIYTHTFKDITTVSCKLAE